MALDVLRSLVACSSSHNVKEDEEIERETESFVIEDVVVSSYGISQKGQVK